MVYRLATCLSVLATLAALSVATMATATAATAATATTPMDPSARWTQLFNGRDLTGWRHVGQGGMGVMQDGALRTGGDGEGLLYWTGGPVGNCTLRIVYRLSGDYDRSGIFVRIPIEPRDLEMPLDYGYRIAIDNHPETSYEDEYHVTGTLDSFTRPLARAWKPGSEWNTLEITLDGSRTIVVLNGVKVTDYTEAAAVPARKLDWEPQRGPRPNKGWIALQNIVDRAHRVFFKEVAMRPLR